MTNPEYTVSRVSETPPAETLRAIIYGGSKTGKTWYFGTAGDRTLIIDTGAGLETLRSPLFKKDVGSDPLVTSALMEKIGERGYVTEAVAFDMVCDILDESLKLYKDDVDTVVIDDMTALQRFALNKGLEVNQKLNKSKTRDKIEKLDAPIVAVQDYGIQMDLIVRFLAAYIDIASSYKKHLIIGAHEKHEFKLARDKEGNIMMGEPPVVTKTYPAFTGRQYPDQINGMFDEIWRTEKSGSGEGLVYRLRITGSAKSVVDTEEIVAGTRHAGVFKESVIRSPNFLRMLDEIRSAYHTIPQHLLKRPA